MCCRRVVVHLEDLERVVSLAVLGPWLYYLDAGTNKVLKVNKTSPDKTSITHKTSLDKNSVILLDRLSSLGAIVAVDEELVSSVDTGQATI